VNVCRFMSLSCSGHFVHLSHSAWSRDVITNYSTLPHGSG
jgi:hypothetical protein